MYTYLRFLIEEDNKKNGGIQNILIKIGSLIFLLGMAIGFGVMPYFIQSCRKSNKFLGLSNAFSGGIFLGMGLFHILPESAEMLKDLCDAPIAYFCSFAAYAIILFVEKIAVNSHSLVHAAHDHCYDHEHECHHGPMPEHLDSPNNSDEKDKNDVIKIEINQNNEKKMDEKNSERKLKNENYVTTVNKIEIKTEKEDENSPNESETKLENSNKKNGISGYILLLALGFHGLFEGISLGIQKTIRDTLFLLLGVALHKWAAALTLGISFVRSGISKKNYVIMILIFSFISPIGIALGLILTSISNDYVAGIFLSLSVGTFIYIACSEVVVDEFSGNEKKWPKFLMFLFGAIVIVGFNMIELFTESGEHHR